MIRGLICITKLLQNFQRRLNFTTNQLNLIGGLTVPDYNKSQMMFNKIRTWAETIEVYMKKGNVMVQYVKLQEEAGELAKALLKDDQPEVIDAIGDMVVVLTNLAHQRGVYIEDMHTISHMKL